MNYLKQIRAFDQWEELHPLSDKAYRLWFKLMAIANASGWDEWLSVPLLKLKSELHTDRNQTVLDTRNILVQAGRIEVRKGKRGKSAEYKLIPFPESSTVPNTGQDAVLKTGPNTVPKTGPNTGLNTGPYYKQNKTKQNKKRKENKRDRPEPDLYSPKKRTYDHDSQEYRLADRLKEKIMGNAPDHKPISESQLQSWSNTFRLMIERDKREPSKIKNLIDWSQQNDFWRTNILSANALRKHYDRLRLQAVEDWKRGNVDPLDYQAREQVGQAYDDEYMRRYQHEFN